MHLRTPGYVSWQQKSWLSHCTDACEFHGDATESEALTASPETKAHWLSEYDQDEEGWAWATQYKPGGQSAFYNFVCRHGRLVMFGRDAC